MGKSSQVKGRRAELELVRLFQSHGIPAEPGQAVSYGATPDIVGVDGVHVEVKRRENVNLSAALEQAQQDAERFGDGLPAVFHRKNREGWRVTMPLEAWLELYRGKPYIPMKTWSAHSIVRRNAIRAGVELPAAERKGFHSFRRTLANWMLEAEIPLEMITEVLGQGNTDSTRPYIAVHQLGLAECALDLQMIPMGREELR